MIAIGRDGDTVVFMGKGGKVQIECTLEEAGAALRQLQAMLGTPQVSAHAGAPQSFAPSRGLIVTPGDAAAEAAANDRMEILRRGPPTPEPAGPVRRGPSPEELAKQERRRERLAAQSNGVVGGPVDE